MQVIGILGAGTLGWRIGLQAAISGFDVVMLDLSEQVLAQAQQRQAKFLNHLIRQERVDADRADRILERITVTTDQDAFAQTVELVSESVTEDLELKRRVWSEFAGLWKPETTLTTNTSYLLPSQLAEASGAPERFCAFHFHDVFDARVVDVMPHPGTADVVVQDLLALGRRLEQIPVLVRRETPGYLFNRMLMSFLGAAGGLLASGTADIEDIDRSWMGNMGTRIGPFGMLDQIGLDTVAHVLAPRQDGASRAFADVIAPLVAGGRLGAKTGEGFYSYPNPRYAQSDFLEP